MSKLWDFNGYVNHLSHKNSIARRWAFNALDNRFKNYYADQVSYLLNDADEHTVCNALRYLSRHGAVHNASMILDKFKSSHGIIRGNCAGALAEMQYEPAMDAVLEKFSNPDTEETFLGVLSYLGSVRSDKCRAALHSAIAGIKDPFLLGPAAGNLLRHYHPEDVKMVMDAYFDPSNRDSITLKNILSPLGGQSYFNELTGYGENLILSNPVETLNNLLFKNSQIGIERTFLESII
ncbi:MAG: HEAT repeat domain-containing protein, partial [Desulfobacterales bacterium]